MNDVDTIDGVVKRATRRKHSAQFKAEVLDACRQPDASAAAIARLYNLVPYIRQSRPRVPVLM